VYTPHCTYEKRCSMQEFKDCSQTDAPCHSTPVEKCKKVKKCHRTPETRCKPAKRMECGMDNILVPKKTTRQKCLPFPPLRPPEEECGELQTFLPPSLPKGPEVYALVQPIDAPHGDGHQIAGLLGTSPGYGAPAGEEYGAPLAEEEYGAPLDEEVYGGSLSGEEYTALLSLEEYGAPPSGEYGGAPGGYGSFFPPPAEELGSLHPPAPPTFPMVEAVPPPSYASYEASYGSPHGGLAVQPQGSYGSPHGGGGGIFQPHYQISREDQASKVNYSRGSQDDPESPGSHSGAPLPPVLQDPLPNPSLLSSRSSSSPPSPSLLFSRSSSSPLNPSFLSSRSSSPPSSPSLLSSRSSYLPPSPYTFVAPPTTNSITATSPDTFTPSRAGPVYPARRGERD